MPEISKKLDGKRIVVTGASRGLGRALAMTFARAGAQVALLARSEPTLERAQEEIHELGGKAFRVQVDVGDYTSVQSAFSEIYRHWPRVDGLVNNAAIVEPLGPVFQLDPTAWKRTIEVDLNGAFYCSREALSTMLDGKGGCIINITSGLARFVLSYFSAYSTAKSGLNTLTLYLAQELAQYGIRVYGLDPGVMDTDMQLNIRNAPAKTLDEETIRIFQGYKQRNELNPPMRSALLALYLMSDAGMEMSGQVGGASHFSQFGYVPPDSIDWK